MIANGKLLLRALTLNAVFCGISAFLMFISASWLAQQFGLSSAEPVYATAALLAVFALQLADIVRTKTIRAWEIRSIISGDIAWVVLSIALITLYYQAITTIALILVDVVAVTVLCLALMQIRGLREIRRMADA